MSYILSKLNTAVEKNISEIRKNRTKDELEFAYTLELASEYLSKIELIFTKDKDIFGYPTKVAHLSDEQWKNFNEMYWILVKIYRDAKNKLICPAYINRFNEISDNLPLISTLEKILNSLEKGE